MVSGGLLAAPLAIARAAVSAGTKSSSEAAMAAFDREAWSNVEPRTTMLPDRKDRRAKR